MLLRQRAEIELSRVGPDPLIVREDGNAAEVLGEEESGGEMKGVQIANRLEGETRPSSTQDPIRTPQFRDYATTIRHQDHITGLDIPEDPAQVSLELSNADCTHTTMQLHVTTLTKQWGATSRRPPSCHRLR